MAKPSPSQRVRLLQSLSEHQRELDYFSGHQALTLLEMIADGLATVDRKHIVQITAHGTNLLRSVT